MHGEIIRLRAVPKSEKGVVGWFQDFDGDLGGYRVMTLFRFSP
jgi:hypothetical protein